MKFFSTYTAITWDEEVRGEAVLLQFYVGVSAKMATASSNSLISYMLTGDEC